MNTFDDLHIDQTSQSFRDLLSQDRWSAFTPVFGSLTVVGATTYTGRYHISGATFEGQVKFLAATSIASVAGTDYLTLPKAAKGLSGFGVMTNDTTNVAVGLCHLDVATSRLYLPTQTASGNTFLLYFKYEI
jgi:hypothetical protein